MNFSEICSKLDKTYILIGTLFIFIIILLLLNNQKSNKIYAQYQVPMMKAEAFADAQKEPETPQKTSNNQLVLYYADWCGWSQKILPVWEELEASGDVKGVVLRKVECEKQPDGKCKSIQGYPTIILFKGDKEINFNSHPRTKEGILKFLEKNL